MKTDLGIQQDVMAELQWEPALGSTEVGVSVKNGIVMLSGVVDSWYKKLLAEKAAKRVEGVTAVVEEIVVKIPGDSRRTDIDIANAVVNALKWDSTVDENKVKVIVDNGTVTLEGEVEWNFQRESAHTALQRLTGVARVVNNLRVRNRVQATDLEHRIASAFQRSATVDAKNVKVQVIGERVILEGTVRSFAEKSDAERTVWSSPGVVQVDNRLAVDSTVSVY